MKLIKAIGAVFLLAAFTVSNLYGQAAPTAGPNDPSSFTVSAAVAQGSAPKLVYAIVPPSSKGLANVQFVSWRNDGITGATLTSYACSNMYTVMSNAAVAVSNIFISSNLGLAVGDVILVRSPGSGKSFRAQVGNVSNITSMAFPSIVLTNYDSATTPTVTIPQSLSAGDAVYRMVTNAQHFVAYGTNTLIGAGSALFSGQYNVPLMFEIRCTNTTGIDNISGIYR